MLQILVFLLIFRRFYNCSTSPIMNINSKHSDLTSKIIKAFFQVYNTLGYGFLEKVYERAMVFELRKMGLNCEPQFPIRVYYETEEVGYYQADIFVEKEVIAELKAAIVLREDDEFQLINYLKGTNVEVGLLFNFGKKPEFQRKVFSNDLKKNLPMQTDQILTNLKRS